MRSQYKILLIVLAVIAVIVLSQTVHCQIVKDYYLIRGDSPEIQITLARAIDRNDSIRFFVALNSVAQSQVSQNAIFALKDSNSFRGDSTQVKLITTTTGVIRIYLTRDLTWLLSESNYAYYIYQNATIRQYGTLRITRSATLEGILNLDTLRNFEITKLNNRVADRADADSLELLRLKDSTRHVADSVLAAHAKDSASHAELTAQTALSLVGSDAPVTNIKYVSPGFSTLSDPYFSTIQAAVNAVTYAYPDKVTIDIGPGIYPEKVTTKNGIIFKGHGNVVIGMTAVGGGNIVTSTAIDTVMFDGITFKRKFFLGYDGSGLLSIANLNSWFTFSNCDFDGGDMYFNGAGFVVAGRIDLHNCNYKGKDGLYFSNAHVNWTANELTAVTWTISGKSDVTINTERSKVTGAGNLFIVVRDTSKLNFSSRYIQSIGMNLGDTISLNNYVQARNKSIVNLTKIDSSNITVAVYDSATANLNGVYMHDRAYCGVDANGTLNATDSWFDLTRLDLVTGLHILESTGGSTATINADRCHFKFRSGTLGDILEGGGGTMIIRNCTFEDSGDVVPGAQSYAAFGDFGGLKKLIIERCHFISYGHLSSSASAQCLNIGGLSVGDGGKSWRINANTFTTMFPTKFVGLNNTRAVDATIDTISFSGNALNTKNDTLLYSTTTGAKIELQNIETSNMRFFSSEAEFNTAGVHSLTLKDSLLTIDLRKIPNGVFQQGITFDSLSVICDYIIPLDSTYWVGGEGGGNDNGYSYAEFQIKNFKSPYHYIYNVESYNANSLSLDIDPEVTSPDTLYSVCKFKAERPGYGVRSLTIFKDRVRSTNSQLVITVVVDNNAYAQTYMQIIPGLCYNIKNFRIVKL